MQEPNIPADSWCISCVQWQASPQSEGWPLRTCNCIQSSCLHEPSFNSTLSQPGVLHGHMQHMIVPMRSCNLFKVLSRGLHDILRCHTSDFDGRAGLQRSCSLNPLPAEPSMTSSGRAHTCDVHQGQAVAELTVQESASILPQCSCRAGPHSSYHTPTWYLHMLRSPHMLGLQLPAEGCHSPACQLPMQSCRRASGSHVQRLSVCMFYQAQVHALAETTGVPGRLDSRPFARFNANLVDCGTCTDCRKSRQRRDKEPLSHQESWKPSPATGACQPAVY